MPDQTPPLVQGFSVKDLADPETIRERALRLSVAAEDAARSMAEVAPAIRQASWSIRELEVTVSATRDEAVGLCVGMLRPRGEEPDHG